MKLAQTTNKILMVRPVGFGFNPETADSNSFQQRDPACNGQEVARLARLEFDDVVDGLRQAELEVIVFEDTPVPRKTDAVFPNNWISSHASGWIITYPMMSPSRRQEVREDILQRLEQEFQVRQIWRWDQQGTGKYLEGTGSMVLDREHRLAFVCRSPRTDDTLVNQFCQRMSYLPVQFDACYSDGVPIYHTNVLMALTPEHGVICLQSIADEMQRTAVQAALESTGRTIVDLSLEQVGQFAGNMLAVGEPVGRPKLVMSTTALASLRQDQLQRLQQECDILAFPIPTIERYGGGSLRCMLAELFLEKQEPQRVQKKEADSA